MLCALLAMAMFAAADLSAAEPPAAGNDTGATAEATMEAARGLMPIDWALVAAYGLGTIGLGWYYGRKQESTSEYFIGSGKMNPVLIGVSLFATLLSTISYLSMPGEALGKGPVWMATTLGYPLVFLIVGFVLLPVYMRQRVMSAYELLETRLGLSVRMLGASLFLILRLVWMSLLIYLTAKAMTVMMGVPEEWIPWIAMVTGAVAVIYTSIGGLKAVVVTDLMQTVLLYGGTLLVIGTVTWDMGGFGWFPTEWHPSWDTQPLFSLDPKVRVTVFGSIFTMLIWFVCTLGGDQTSVQRFMATEDASAARRACAVQMSVAVVVNITLALVGFALLGYFTAHPEFLPDGKNMKDNADDLFPHFIAYHLPVGVSGLVVSAMFAAAMSSMDSGVNSITAVVMRDFLDRFGRAPKTERQHVLTARTMAFTIGITVVACSSLLGQVPGNITAVTNKTANLLTVPIFSLFFFALFVPFAKPIGAWAGTLCGAIAATAIAFSGPLVVVLAQHCGVDPAVFNVGLITNIDAVTGAEYVTAPDPVSFQWMAPVALATAIVTGTVVSLIGPGETVRQRTMRLQTQIPASDY